MEWEFARQCCDAEVYLTLGEICSRTLHLQCWDSLRPIGSAVYFSVPYLLGISPKFIIVMNFLLLALSVYLGNKAVGETYSFTHWNNLYVRYAIVTLPHLVFMYDAAWNALSDVPAACFALIGIWFLILGIKKAKVWLYAISGLSLGLAAFIRAFYLYPVLLTALCIMIAFVYYKFQPRIGVVFFIAMLGIPILYQFQSTYRHTGQWSYLNEAATAPETEIHFTRPQYGYDTVSMAPYPYDASNCFKEPGGLKGAVQNKDLYGILCIFVKRQTFYFESHAFPFNQVYLLSPNERVFSPLILILHGAVLAWVFYFVWHSKVKSLFFIPAVLIGSIWMEGTLIRPESRYLMVLYVFLWVYGLWGAYFYLCRYLEQRSIRIHGVRGS